MSGRTERPPSRFFVRFSREVASPILGRRTVEQVRNLETPATLAHARSFEGLVAKAALTAAAIGQASEIARRERGRVELYERLEIRDVTGPRDGARTWDWRQQLRAVEEPPA